MSKYAVILSKKARKQLDKITDPIANPILKVLGDLENNPSPQGCKKLSGR